MKTLRFAIAAVVIGSVSAFATNARVESMGKNSTFIMDDISIFDNPANINLYPNFLIGELGVYTGPGTETVDAGENHDPWHPWFGGIFSLDIGGGNSLSIAGVLNRKEERLLRYFPDYLAVKKGASELDYIKMPTPVTNFDGFLGANFNNKAFGMHIYIAHQDGLDGNNNINKDAYVSALQLDLGTNIEISSNYSLEFAVGTARLQYGPSDRGLFDGNLFSLFADARMFSKVSAINGHLIPVASFRNMNAAGRDEMDIGLGMGVDAAFDRGFFWLGLKGFYNVQHAYANWIKDLKDGEVITVYYDLGDDKFSPAPRSTLWQFGGTISFGIERNIWWDWFVLRVGGQKNIAYADYKKGKNNDIDRTNNILCPSNYNLNGCESGNYFITNPVNDGTINDNVGFGFGINVEEKLKIDFTVAEDVVFRNPFQGEGRLMSRVSASYSF
ncbi:MAG: hypothetical protein LBB36_05325 [Fibromonadaceae bacterium]|jgi:hypothetical protein|nr:hypothetical protein [Fibromonadaceae bacterium]